MRRYPCEESTVDIVYSGVRVRLWIDNPGGEHPELAAVSANVVYDELKKWTGAFNVLTFAEKLAAYHDRLPQLAAIQVIKLGGAWDLGHMIYTKPFTD